MQPDNTQTKSMYSKIFSLENKTNSNTDVAQDMKFEEMSPKIMKKVIFNNCYHDFCLKLSCFISLP